MTAFFAILQYWKVQNEFVCWCSDSYETLYPFLFAGVSNEAALVMLRKDDIGDKQVAIHLISYYFNVEYIASCYCLRVLN